MDYYLVGKEDPLLAVYVVEGVYRAVFKEKYGDLEIPFSNGMTKIQDKETIVALDKYMMPYEEGKPKVYMAGPLFNEGDRYTNKTNSDALRSLGYTTFLPQEVVINNDSSELVKASCFYMDLKAIRLCDFIVANCNGIEIDSGTAAEIGLGYGWGKRTVLYKSDVRNYYNETFKVNNFVGGLVGNKVCTTLDEVIEEMKNM